MTAPALRAGDVIVWTTDVMKIEHRSTIEKVEEGFAHVLKANGTRTVVPLFVSTCPGVPTIADYLKADGITVLREGRQIHPIDLSQGDLF